MALIKIIFTLKISVAPRFPQLEKKYYPGARREVRLILTLTNAKKSTMGQVKLSTVRKRLHMTIFGYI